MQSIKCTGAFLLSAMVWLGGSALGYGVVAWATLLPESQRALPTELATPTAAGDENGTDGFAESRERARGADESPLDAFLFIYGRNATVYIWLLAGLLSAGLVTFLVLVANGLALGQTVALATQSGVPFGAVMEWILPHGVLEFGAFCIAGAVGFQGFKLAMGRIEWRIVRTFRLGWVFAFGVVALAVAAGVEAVITADLADSFNRGAVGAA